MEELRKIVREVVYSTYKGDDSGEYHTTSSGNEKYFGGGGAGLIAVNKNNEVLLGLRSEEVNEPGTWSYPGGKIDNEEDSKNSAQREFKEETGYNGKYENIRLLDKFVDKKNNFTYYTYTANVHDFEPELNWENDDCGWFDLDNLPSPLHFGFEAILSKVKNRKI